jgi:hypothetical protein
VAVPENTDALSSPNASTPTLSSAFTSAPPSMNAAASRATMFVTTEPLAPTMAPAPATATVLISPADVPLTIRFFTARPWLPVFLPDTRAWAVSVWPSPPIMLSASAPPIAP